MDSGALRCRPCISEIDLQSGRLILKARLAPPFAALQEEKNWSIFSNGDALLCIYSIQPYIVLRIDLDQEGCTEIFVRDDNLYFPWYDKGGQFISNSTNVIEWDTSTYITFIHDYLQPSAIDVRNRVYLQYGMLIDKDTFRPTSIIPEPLLIGGSEDGRHSGVHYTTALVNRADGLYAFYGEGDSHTGVVIIEKDKLNNQFKKNRLAQ
jgi:hypothetical protein